LHIAPTSNRSHAVEPLPLIEISQRPFGRSFLQRAVRRSEVVQRAVQQVLLGERRLERLEGLGGDNVDVG
jgi:hypothetical protein